MTGRDRTLEPAIGDQCAEVSQLEAGPDDPEPGIHEPEKTEQRQPDPVGRDQHAKGARIERRLEILPEAELHRLARHQGLLHHAKTLLEHGILNSEWDEDANHVAAGSGTEQNQTAFEPP
jgi:hypothetical protein